ncbi:MAG TPA: protein kinase, partial [Verrucomicrobium sp.]|nr:protein kinase [Verrucomicrobium sp.]
SFHGMDKGSVVTTPGLKMLLGKPTAFANLKDGVVHLLHKVSDTLVPNSKGSHYKEALRLVDQYEGLKNSGGSSQDKLVVLRNLKQELERHSPGGSRGEMAGKLAQFVEAEITVHECVVEGESQDAQARTAQDLDRTDVVMTELAQGRSLSGHDLRDEIRSFGSSSLHQVKVPEEGEGSPSTVPGWAKMEFSYNSLKSDVIGVSPQGTVKSVAPLLLDPGLSALSDGFKASPAFTGAATTVNSALVGGDPHAIKTAADHLASGLARDISSQGRLSETSFAISDGAKFKEELFEAFKATGATQFTGKFADAPDDVRSFFDGVFQGVLDRLPDQQTASDKVVIGGNEYTKGAKLGQGGFGEVYLYERQYEVTDAETGEKRTVTEQIAVKSFISGSLDEAAREVRAHQSAMGPQGHENVIGMKGVIRTPGGEVLIAMELAKTSTFEMMANLDKAVEAGTLSPLAANAVRLTLLKDMLKGMQHFQEERGMTHLDVKEPNFFIGLDGRAKLGDFGTARTGASTVIGAKVVDNPIWKAPEVLLEEAAQEERFAPIKEEMRAQKQATKEFLQTQNLTREEFLEWSNKAADGIEATKKAREDAVGAMTVTNKADTWSVGISAYRLFKGEYPFDHPQFLAETENLIKKYGSDAGSHLGEFGLDQSGNSTGKAVTALDRLLNDMLHPDPQKRPSITDLLRNPVFDEPFVGDDDVYGIIKELSEGTPDPAKLKALSASLGD